MGQAEVLLDQALSASQIDARRDAFIKLLDSPNWRMVLAPHVISKMCADCGQQPPLPDLESFRLAAPIIGANEEKIHRSLSFIESPFGLEMVGAVAKHMGAAFVEHALDHLRTAEGDRITLLISALEESDRKWVCSPEAQRIIKRLLRIQDHNRIYLLGRLGEEGKLREFIDDLHDLPPVFMEEWRAFGIAQIDDPFYLNLALASLGETPEPLAYLLRLPSPPPGTAMRIMSAAKMDWLITALEVGMVEHLEHPVMFWLAELAVRWGGRPLATAINWINMQRLSKDLLILLQQNIKRVDGRTIVNDELWVQRRSASSTRAQEQGRRGESLDEMDAAALVRQMRGEKAAELAREIVVTPLPSMFEPVLHHLCAVNIEAAHEIMQLINHQDPKVVERVRQVISWPDVRWPSDLLATLPG